MIEISDKTQTITLISTNKQNKQIQITLSNKAVQRGDLRAKWGPQISTIDKKDFGV